MTVQYRELAVPVDPEFADELKAQLDARLVRRDWSPDFLPADDQPIRLRRIPEVTFVLTPDQRPEQRWRRVPLLAVAAVAVLAAGTVLVLTNHDADRPADTPPSAITDRQFAAAVALTPHDWGPQYTFGRFATQFRMARELAETVPECAPFLDTVFESPDRPATVTVATAALGTRAGPSHWQYVVVFPDVEGAEAMMDAVRDLRYPDCEHAYQSELSTIGAFTTLGRAARPSGTLAGDESAVVNTNPYVRRGRTVMTFDANYVGRAQHVIIARAVERVDAAEAGTPLPSLALPLEYVTRSAVHSLGRELWPDWSGSRAPEWILDRSAGLSVPSCAAFIDVFLPPRVRDWGDDEYDPAKPFAHTTVTLETDPQTRGAPEGVFRTNAIGYRRLQDAEEAMDAILEPGFSRCLADYTSAQPANEAWRATTREPISLSALSRPLGDENVQMLFEGRYIGLDGTTGPAGRIVAVFIRVDNVLIGVEVTLDHMSTEQFETVLHYIVDQAEAAVAGAPMPYYYCSTPTQCQVMSTGA